MLFSQSRNLCRIMVVSLFSVVILGAGKVEGSVSLGYSFNETLTEDDTGRFVESQRHALSGNMGQSLTDRITLQERLGYNLQITDDPQRDRETLSPALLFGLKNDLFDLGLEGLASKRLDPAGASVPDAETIEMRVASSWAVANIPNLGLSALRQTSGRNESLGYNTYLDWRIGFVNAAYNYRKSTNSSGYGVEELDTAGHSGNISTGGAFLKNRLRVNLGYHFSDTQNTRTVTAGATNLALINLTVTEVRTGQDDPLDLIELPAASINPQLLDNDLLTGAYSVPVNTVDHTFLLVLNGQETDMLYLYAPDNWGGGGVVPPDLTNWRLYSNDILGTAWNVEAINPAAITYDSFNQRLEIPVPAVQQNYLKLVFDRTLTALPAIDFTEVQAVNIVPALQGTLVGTVFTEKSNTSSLGANLTLNRNISLNYSGQYRTESGTARQEETAETITNNLTLRYANEKGDFTSSLTFNDRLSSGLNVEGDYISRSFGINVKKIILPTLEVSLSENHTEIYLAGRKERESDKYGFYCNARLYPDLESKLDVTYDVSKNIPESLDNQKQEINFSVTSRLRPSFNVTLIEVYKNSMRTGADDDKSLRSGLSFAWRISQILNLNGGYSTVGYSDDRQGSQNYSANLVAALSDAMQLDVSYNVVQTDSQTQAGRANFYWNVSRGVRLRVGAEYFKAAAAAANNLKLLGELSVRLNLI